MNDMRPIPQNVPDRPTQKKAVAFSTPPKPKTTGPAVTPVSDARAKRLGKARPGSKKKNPLRHKQKKVCNATCRDCGLKQERHKRDFFHAAQPRCVGCGGLLDTQAAFAKRIRHRY